MNTIHHAAHQLCHCMMKLWESLGSSEYESPMGSFLASQFIGAVLGIPGSFSWGCNRLAKIRGNVCLRRSGLSINQSWTNHEISMVSSDMFWQFSWRLVLISWIMKNILISIILVMITFCIVLSNVADLEECAEIFGDNTGFMAWIYRTQRNHGHSCTASAQLRSSTMQTQCLLLGEIPRPTFCLQYCLEYLRIMVAINNF